MYEAFLILISACFVPTSEEVAFRSIVPGMTIDQVANILGRPADNVSLLLANGLPASDLWVGDEGTIAISADSKGEVAAVWFVPSERSCCKTITRRLRTLITKRKFGFR